MNINLSLFAQALTFALFIWFTVRFVWPPLMRAIEERQKTIADGLAAAERGRLDLEQATHRSAQVLREAKQQAQEILAQADRRAAEIVEEAKTAAKAEGERLVAGAKADIEREIARAREALRAQVAALVVAGAEQILRREVDEKAHADLLAAIQREL